jgi:type IV pilus modification protein PilV
MDRPVRVLSEDEAMTIKKIQANSARRNGGFSMIDVLVAIVVLATALLALAALQGALTRNSADARARSQVAAYADGLLDQLRASGYDNITDGTSTLSPSSGTTAQKAAATAVQTAAGVSGLSTTVTTDHYYGDTGSFITTAPSSVDSSTPQYKQINVTTAWTDASGQSRVLELSTIVSPISVDTSNNSLVTQLLTPTISNTPVVRQYNPAATAGVIPIAMSNNTADTAATNPQPEILGSKTQLLAGVSYNVLTYTAPATVAGNANETQITKLVDTRVIRCSCKYGAGLTDTTNVFTQPYRPTFWGKDFKYTSPEATSSKTSNYGADPSATQDEFCDICCRDRNDTGSETVLFNPWNSDYGHYFYSGATLTAVPGCDATGCSGTDTTAYVNACRLIRVDGQYRVATDLQNYFYGVIATDTAKNTGIPASSSSTNTASSPIPSSTAQSSYQAFVIDYLSLDHTLSKATTFTNTKYYPYDSPADPTTSGSTAAAKYAALSLTNPTNIDITYSAATTDYRYLHARGLLIDHLESETVTALNNAISNCAGTTSTLLEDCIFPDLPFTTINLTQLSNWATDTAGSKVISVTDTAITGGDPDNPLRGVANALSTALTGASGNAVGSTYAHNSGLTGVVSKAAITPLDANETLDAFQQFTCASGCQSSVNLIYFNFSLSGLPQIATNPNVSADPTLIWAGTAAQLGTAASGTSVADPAFVGSSSMLYVANAVKSGKTYTTTPNSASPTIATPVGLNVTVQYYNAQTLGSATTGGGVVGCTSVVNTTCRVNQVSSITIGATTVSGWTTAPLNSSDLYGLNAGTIITSPNTPGLSSTNSASPDLMTINFTQDATHSSTVTGTCGGCKASGKGCTYTPGKCSN